MDTNVVLDLILARAPWAEESALLFSEIELGNIEGYIAAHTITTIHYLVAKAKGRPQAANVVADLLSLVRVAPLEDSDFQRALTFNLPDFEDAVQVAAAVKVEADFLVTRNARDFRGSPIPIRTAGGVLPLV